MIEFNADGSIRLPGNISDEKRKLEHRMNNTRCAKVRKEVISKYAPKSCCVYVNLSPMIKDPRQIEEAFNRLKTNAETPINVVKRFERDYAIEIGTNFRRCTECNLLLTRLRDILDGNVIFDKGSCTLKEREFCFEDYFE